MLIGQPKSLEEFRTLSAPELIHFFQHVEQTATSGIDMQLPMGIPVGDVARLAATTRRYHKIAFELDTLAREIPDDETAQPGENLKKMLAIVARLSEHLHIEAPKAPSIIQPASPIIVPK